VAVDDAHWLDHASLLALIAMLRDLASAPLLVILAADLHPGRAELDELEWHRWLVSEARGYSFLARVVRQVVEQDMLTPGQRLRVMEAAARVSSN